VPIGDLVEARPTEEGEAGAAQKRLSRGAIGPWGLAALAIGITSPAMGLFGLWGPMQAEAGPVTPLIFVAAMLVTLPTAISYALLNREAPAAGSAANWLWTSVSPSAGYLAGMWMLTYFIMATAAQPLLFALFFRDFLHWLQSPLAPQVAMVGGILFATLPVVWVGLSGAEASIRTTVTLMLLETLVVVSLSVTILLAKAGETGGINLAPFDPAMASGGVKGFWSAMILGVLAYCGFDVVSTAAEEADAPREFVPKAIMLTIFGITLFWAVNAWALTLASPPEKVLTYSSQGLTAVTPVAQSYWGAGNLLVILTAFTGITAVYISCMQGASRLLFTLARQGALPSGLSRLSTSRLVPRVAVVTVLGLTLLLDFTILMAVTNGMQAFLFWANGLVFFATLTFTCVNIANITTFHRNGRSRLLPNRVVPALGITVNLYLLYKAFFDSLWNSTESSDRAVVVLCLVLLALQVTALLWMRARRSDLLVRPPYADDPVETAAVLASPRQ
jgi:amino acid transporter